MNSHLILSTLKSFIYISTGDNLSTTKQNLNFKFRREQYILSISDQLNRYKGGRVEVNLKRKKEI